MTTSDMNNEFSTGEEMRPFNCHYIKKWHTHPQIFHGFGTRWDGGRKLRKDWFGQVLRIEEKEYPVVALRQVHGDEVLIYHGEDPKDLWYKEGDALLTQIPGYALAVFTADCFPILIFDPRKAVVGIIHTGWRGTAKGVVGKVISKMEEVFKSAPQDIQVAIGPGICASCLEVDAPVREAFQEAQVSWERIAKNKGDGKWLLDIYQANYSVLKTYGIKEENIFSLNDCPCCNLQNYYSYRGEGRETGRMINFIGLKKT